MAKKNGKSDGKPVSRQTSIPGSNIPELEELAERYRRTVRKRIALQKVEAEEKLALDALIEDLQKKGKIKAPDDIGVIYRYQSADEEGDDEKPREITWGNKRILKVNTAKKDGSPPEAAA